LFSLSEAAHQINIVTGFRGKTRRFRVGGPKRSNVVGTGPGVGPLSVVYGVEYAPVSVAGWLAFSPI